MSTDKKMALGLAQKILTTGNRSCNG